MTAVAPGPEIVAPAAQPVAATPAPNATPAPDGNIVRAEFSRAQLDAFGGDYHKMVEYAKNAKMFEDQVGMPFTDIASEWLKPAAPETPVATPAPAAQPDPNAPLTADAIQKILDARDAKAQGVQQQYFEQQTRQQVNAARSQLAQEVVKETGMGLDDKGQPNIVGQTLDMQFQIALDRAIVAQLPPWQQRDETARNNALYMQAPSQAAVEAAKASMKQFVDTITQLAIARGARAQQGLPGSTLGAGAGGAPGAQPGKYIDQMNAAEKVAFVSAQLARSGQPG